MSIAMALCTAVAYAQEPLRRATPEVRAMITVLRPNGGEELVHGTEFIFSWQASESMFPKVRVYLEDEWDVGHFLGETRNTGTYRWTVSPDLRRGSYKLVIKSTDEKASDTSDEWFEIIPPEVELTCGFSEYGRFSKSIDLVISGSSVVYLKITAFVENKGTRTLDPVFFSWALLREPTNDVVLQEEAGFSDVYPDRRYSTTFEYEVRKSRDAWFIEVADRSLRRGEYTFVFEVDPDNVWREADWARENNKCEANLTVR
jgi:hypothetical protein